ncbi:MAG: tRNA 2-selenouridine(34) synthase MnmH [Burkholderiales bacterium]|nr:tRNA 2-selenouridine(34) synthase MnmH [Burkholderiales bacterium]
MCVRDCNLTPPAAGRLRHSRTRNVREPAPATVAQLAEFDEVIDVRSESEFAADHVSGASSCPVLSDEERARVGTIHRQRSPFEARKIGSALVAANISRHLAGRFLDRPREWRPLVYCWRGGQRSGAVAHVLAEIGWHTGRLAGGYRAYRRAVIDDLERLPGAFTWRVFCGLTGTGKSLLLRALAAAGAQVLDLESLAAHRGSVLGALPGERQPPQKLFESRLWRQLSRFDPARPVHVEAESRRIGALGLPGRLVDAMRAAGCVRIEAPVALRVALLRREYPHLTEEPAALAAGLDALVPLHGRERVNHWQALAAAGEWDELTRELLERHYDPAYSRAINRHYPALSSAPKLQLEKIDEEAFAAVARECLAGAPR